MIKIVIVEDLTILRQSLEHLLNTQDDMDVVGCTDDASKSLELCRQLKPDLVLMDVVTKNNASGIRYTTELLAELPDLKIIIMTGLPEMTFAEDAKKAGAHSFISKEIESDHLFHVIRTTVNGYSTYSYPSGRLPFSAEFNEKEIAIIRMACQMLERNEMAKKMNLSEAMISKHIKSILDKTGFDSIGKFAIFASSKGFVVSEIH